MPTPSCCRLQLNRRLNHFRARFLQLNRRLIAGRLIAPYPLNFFSVSISASAFQLVDENPLSSHYSGNLLGQRVGPAHGAPHQLLAALHREFAKQDAKRIQIPLTHAARTAEAEELQGSLTQQTGVGETDDGNLKALLLPYPADEMRMWEISARVNSPKNDDPSLWEPFHAQPTETTTDALELLRE
jgi:hypothetical protein